MTSVLLVCGSNAAESFTARLLSRVHHDLVERGHVVTALALADVEPAALLRRDHSNADVALSIGLVRSARILVLGTPVHNDAYSGVLKAWLDVLPRHALAGRRVITASCGHSPTARGSVDAALRPVFRAMGAEHVEPGGFALDTASIEAAAGVVAELCDSSASAAAAAVPQPFSHLVSVS